MWQLTFLLRQNAKAKVFCGPVCGLRFSTASSSNKPPFRVTIASMSTGSNFSGRLLLATYSTLPVLVSRRGMNVILKALVGDAKLVLLCRRQPHFRQNKMEKMCLWLIFYMFFQVFHILMNHQTAKSGDMQGRHTIHSALKVLE